MKAAFRRMLTVLATISSAAFSFQTTRAQNMLAKAGLRSVSSASAAYSFRKLSTSYAGFEEKR